MAYWLFQDALEKVMINVSPSVTGKAKIPLNPPLTKEDSPYNPPFLKGGRWDFMPQMAKLLTIFFEPAAVPAGSLGHRRLIF